MKGASELAAKLREAADDCTGKEVGYRERIMLQSADALEQLGILVDVRSNEQHEWIARAREAETKYEALRADHGEMRAKYRRQIAELSAVRGIRVTPNESGGGFTVVASAEFEQVADVVIAALAGLKDGATQSAIYSFPTNEAKLAGLLVDVAAHLAEAGNLLASYLAEHSTKH